MSEIERLVLFCMTAESPAPNLSSESLEELMSYFQRMIILMLHSSVRWASTSLFCISQTKKWTENKGRPCNGTKNKLFTRQRFFFFSIPYRHSSLLHLYFTISHMIYTFYVIVFPHPSLLLFCPLSPLFVGMCSNVLL